MKQPRPRSGGTARGSARRAIREASRHVLSEHQAARQAQDLRDLGERLRELAGRSRDAAQAAREREASLQERQTWQVGQKNALQAALDGASLEESLGLLARTTIDQMGGGTRAAFYLADDAGKKLHHVVGMSPDYARAVEDSRIGPESLACGLGTRTGKAVLATDVREEPLWRPWLPLAERFGYRGCWIFPIHTVRGQLIGVFAVYNAHPREAEPRARELAWLMTQTASVLISNNREAEARRRVEAELRDADRRKNEFLGMLAHELRNPLAPIGNAVRILRLTGHDPEALRSATDMLERQVGQMVRLVDDLLDVSRISRGRIELRKEPIELQAIAGDAVEAARPVAQAMEHELTATWPRNPIRLHADPTRLAQVIGNLLNNACKYTGRGGRISLTMEREGAQAVVRVSDNGIGIPGDQLGRIFEIFAQVDSTLERSTGGLGIGLTLVKSLVEMHAGTVEARSDGVGRGSEFIVRLPITSSAPPADSGQATLFPG